VIYVLDLWNRIKFDFFYVLGLIITILLLIKFFNISFFGIWLVIGFFSSLRLIFFKEYSIKKHLKAWLVTGLFILAIYVLTSALGILGAWLVLLGFLVYRFWSGRKLFMNSLRFIEKTVFGKPLDKKEFEKGEKPSIYKKEDKK
jgi:hypothetical protein